MVYTIAIETAPCKLCQYGKDMNYNIQLCNSFNMYECPNPAFYIEEHICEAFLITKDGLSKPGLIDYEGFSEFLGYGDKSYLSKNSAIRNAKKYAKAQSGTFIKEKGLLKHM